MNVEIEVGGHVHQVSVERGDGGFRVAIDGQPYAVDVAAIDPTTLSLLVRGQTDASYEVGLAERVTAGEFDVYLRAGVVYTRVNRRSRSGVRRSAGADPFAAAGGVQQVVAPMPGRIVRVLVSPGDTVAARQGLVVVEAMKMENEIRAPRAGQVREVLVGPGVSVEAGRPLVVLE